MQKGRGRTYTGLGHNITCSKPELEAEAAQSKLALAQEVHNHIITYLCLC